MKVKFNVTIDVENKTYLHEHPELNASQILNDTLTKLRKKKK